MAGLDPAIHVLAAEGRGCPGQARAWRHRWIASSQALLAM